MAYSHKTQSFMKNGGEQKCLHKAPKLYKNWPLNDIAERFPKASSQPSFLILFYVYKSFRYFFISIIRANLFNMTLNWDLFQKQIITKYHSKFLYFS